MLRVNQKNHLVNKTLENKVTSIKIGNSLEPIIIKESLRFYFVREVTIRELACNWPLVVSKKWVVKKMRRKIVEDKD